jgi:hypothetical protein
MRKSYIAVAALAALAGCSTVEAPASPTDRWTACVVHNLTDGPGTDAAMQACDAALRVETGDDSLRPWLWCDGDPKRGAYCRAQFEAPLPHTGGRII